MNEKSDADTLVEKDSTVSTEKTQSVKGNQKEGVEEDKFAGRSIFRRPSPWWIRLLIFIVGVAVAATVAPALDIYTALVCEEIRPEFAPSLRNSSTGISWTKIPIPSKECMADPAVQGGVAALVTAMDISMAVLSCLTVGYWMQLSDRYGRVKVLLLSEFGLVANQLIILLVSLFPHKLPGGYRFYLFAQVFEGLLGGRMLVVSILSVYVTDTSAPDSRTVNLGITNGLGALGNSLGPYFGAFLVKRNNDLLSVYDFAVKALIVLTLITISFVPEPLTTAKLNQAQKAFASTHDSPKRASSGVGQEPGYYRKLLRLATTPFESLEVFLPRDTKDYSLFLIGCICVVQSLAENYSRYTFQYLQRVLGWDSQDSGVWLGYNEAASAAFLVMVLPLMMRWLKNKFGTTDHAPTASSANPIQLDYTLLLFSECLTVIPLFLLSIIRNSTGFYTLSLLKTLSLGYDSSLKSLAISLYTRRQGGQDSETGKLLCGLSVLGMVSGSVIGPVIFGWLYSRTVEHFPQAIFLLASGLGLATIFLILRLHDKEGWQTTARKDT